MADQQTKSLILKFTADTLPAQRQIQALSQIALGSFLAVGASANRSSSALADLANKAQSLRGVADHIPIVGGLIGRSLGLIAGLAQEAQKEIAELVHIADASRAAGVGTTFFQAYISQAQALGVETSTLVNELNKARDAGKVSIGKLGDDDAGKSDALKTLGKTVAAGNLGSGDMAAFQNADADEARIRVMLDLLDKLDAKGAKLAEYDLANKFFGESFEARLRAGTDAIGDMRDSLDKINQSGGAMIVPPEQIAHAKMMQAEIAELNERLTAITAPAVQKIDGLFQNVDEVLIAGEAAVVHYTEALGEFIAKWLGAGNSIAWANSKVLELANALRDLAGMKPLTIESGGQVNTDDPTGEKMARARKNLALQMGADAPEPSRRPDDLDLTPYGTLPMTVHGHTKKPVAPADTSHPYLADDKSGGKSGKEDPVASYIDELKKSAAAEEAEARTLGLNDKAKQEALDLAKAQAIAQKEGRSLTEAETATIKQQADAYAAAKVKIDQFNKAQADAKARAEFLGQAFESSIEKMALEGGKLKDVLLDVVKQLEQAALKALILGQGPLAGLFGSATGGMNGEGKGFGGLGGLLGFATSSLGGASTAAGSGVGLGALTSLGKGFAGLFADGGTIPPGMFGIAGEGGHPEIINGPATVTPQKAIDRMLGSMGGGGTQVTHAPTYNITPARGVSIEEMTAVIDKNNRDFARNINTIVANGQRRYG